MTGTRRPSTLIEPKLLIPPHEHLAALLAQIERSRRGWTSRTKGRYNAYI